MSTNTRTSTRPTVASLSTEVASLGARMGTLEGKLDLLLAAVTDGDAPAKTTRTKTARKAPARKAPAKKAAPKPAAKGAQTRETLSRKDWNRTLTTLAKTQPKGSGAYKAVLAAWDQATQARDAGMTPQEALALILG